MNCQNCKNPIPHNSTECEWCGNKLANKNDSNNEISDIDGVVLNMLKQGQALNAVKFKKDNSNLNLKESKDYVDSLALKNGLASKKGCFIATACYGDYESAEVKEFRIYRDNVLLKNKTGRILVEVYYYFSPPIANLISKSEISKRIIKTVFLKPILNLIKN